jgi:hypothetical protein
MKRRLQRLRLMFKSTNRRLSRFICCASVGLRVCTTEARFDLGRLVPEPLARK